MRLFCLLGVAVGDEDDVFQMCLSGDSSWRAVLTFEYQSPSYKLSCLQQILLNGLWIALVSIPARTIISLTQFATVDGDAGLGLFSSCWIYAKKVYDLPENSPEVAVSSHRNPIACVLGKAIGHQCMSVLIVWLILPWVFSAKGSHPLACLCRLAKQSQCRATEVSLNLSEVSTWCQDITR